MDRNFRTFLILAIGLFLIYMGLNRMLVKDKPALKPVAKAADKDSSDTKQSDDTTKSDDPAKSDDDLKSDASAKSDATASGDKQADPNAAKVSAPVDVPSDAPKSDSPKSDAPKPDASKEPLKNDEPSAEPPVPEQIFTLGSMDPTKGYRLLVTLTNRGAGIERVELVDERKEDRFRYRALEHQGGYLGYLAPRSVDQGVQITSVPDGSPAATAKADGVVGGLKAGDIIESVDDQVVLSGYGLQRLLLKKKPESTITLAVVRTIDGKKTNLKFTAELLQPPLDVLRTHENITEQVKGNLERLSLLSTLATVDEERVPVGLRAIPKLKPTLSEHWDVVPLEVPGGQGIEFRLPLSRFLKGTSLPSELILVKRYRLKPVGEATGAAAVADAYAIDYETSVENHNGQPVKLALRQEGLTGETLEGWWYSVKISPYFFRGAGQRDVRYADGTNQHQIVLTREIYDRKLKTPRDPGLFISEGGPPETRNLSYLGIDSQYFASALVPHPEAPDGLKNIVRAGTDAVAVVKDLRPAQAQATNVTFWFDTEEETVAPGASLTKRYRIFAGPKDPAMLAHFGMDRFIEYGWFPMIAKPLSFVLYAFYSVVRNYGIAIILLTLLVRGCMFPIGRQAAINGQKMQEMQPELKKINDQYKDDMQGRATAVRELYSKYNFRPLSSCLPMFFQIPIFIGLYRCLSVDISLRQEPLIPGISWCSNLAGPDMLYDWSSWMPDIIAGRGTGYLGPYFNILPVITVSLFLVQQKVLMPKATDEQTRMTQNMMQVMTVVMGVMFFKVPSGLCIYFITSSLWSLAERKLVKRLLPPKPTTPSTTAGAERATRPAAVGSVVDNKKDAKPKAPSRLSEMMAELREMLDKPAMKSGTHRNSEQDRRRENDGRSAKDKKRKRDH
ncbi:MAG: membrane protein insertase YidC [Pirellulales bacterium]